MLDGTYDVSAQTPLGVKNGTFTLASCGNTVAGTLKAPVLGTVKGSGQLSGNTFAFSGELKVMLVGRVSYTVEGLVEGDRLQAVCRTPKGDFVVEGTRR